MKIYTKTGDRGETGVFAGPRVRKDDRRIEAYGTVDELNALLGLVRTAKLPADIETIIVDVQHRLFDLGAELATPDPQSQGTNLISSAEIELLERAIDQFDAQLPPLAAFILPGGTPAAAWLHLARTVCRRAERRAVTLAGVENAKLSEHVVVYLNRLGDLLFVLARAANHGSGQPDVKWQKNV
jgi:cob(I)alamin adenosyltransferase